MKRLLIVGLLLTLLVLPVMADTYDISSAHIVYEQAFPFTYTSASQADVEDHCQIVFGPSSHATPTPHQITFYAYTSIWGLNEAYYTSYDEVKTTTKTDSVWAMQGGYCTNTSSYIASVYVYMNSSAPVVTSNFNGTPLSGTAPLPVSFVDMSLNATSWNWSVSPPGGVSIINPTSADTMVYFGTVGNYTITHGASNSDNSDIETKTDYIYVYNSTATITTGFTAIDAMDGNTIYNATFGLFDVQNNSWSNTTHPVLGIAYITTLSGHTIGSSATALGYSDSDYVVVPALAGAPYVILLFPPALPPGEGNTNLFVSIQDYDTHLAIQGATVTTRLPTGAQQGTTTNAAGIATFVVPNQTLVIIGASKAGYQSASDTINSGSGVSASDIIYLHRLVVTPTITTTVTPTGTGTISPNVTVDARTSAEKQTAMANMVLEFGPLLVNLFIILTIVGGIKLIAKK